MISKFLCYDDTGEGFNVGVFTEREDLPGDFLGEFKHEEAIEPMGGVGFPFLRNFAFQKLRDLFPDRAAEINLTTVAFQAMYEPLLGDAATERDPIPVATPLDGGEPLPFSESGEADDPDDVDGQGEGDKQ